MDKKQTKKDSNDEKKEETAIYKPVKVKKEKKGKKEKKKKKHPKLRMLIKILLIMFILICVIGGGVLAAIVYRCVYGDWAISKKDLQIPYENAVLYDKYGEVCATLAGDENRQIISKEEMSPYLFKAFISIEDERFETHNGVDWKRTLGATLTFLSHSGESSYGGSTITQQTIKNLKDEREDSGIAGILRKIKEICRAYEAENILSKDQILELYLNLIPLGSDKYGVETASIHYFNKHAKDLSLVECACLAGITHSPSVYNPFSEKDPYTPLGENKKTTDTNKRTKTVLKKMKELGKISEEEYNTAVNDIDTNGIKFEKGSSSQETQLTYYLKTTVEQVAKDMMEKEGYSSLEEAKTHLFAEGYKIYTAYDPKVQAEVNKEFVDNAKKWYVIKKVTRTNKETGETYKEEVQRQGAMAIIDNETGYVVAGAGALGDNTAIGTNRLTIKGHSPGSCAKPIAVVGPSMQEGLITLGSVVDDTPISFGGYAPNNWYKWGYTGYMNIREIIECSSNVPEVKLLRNLTVDKSLSYLSKMGVDVSAENDVGLSLALRWNDKWYNSS